MGACFFLECAELSALMPLSLEQIRPKRRQAGSPRRGIRAGVVGSPNAKNNRLDMKSRARYLTML